ncbi:glycosyltransferase 87 family protein [Psychromicrobium lacuslunae]|uniref:glycosyltransferase 87 family protein n=1 Tax=Psychromicrobium lacuslunae TaxID=1618207 RepID=UPI000699094B|nr:glycosyltransferase 87 family protein [Psychromicrobium lacuslunae]
MREDHRPHLNPRWSSSASRPALGAWLLALLCLLAALTWFLVDLSRLSWLIPGLSRTSPSASIVLLCGTILCWLVFTLAVLVARTVLRSLKPRKAAAWVLIGCTLLGSAAVSATPASSNDSARYAWDGIVQKNGISPYQYLPVDPALERLRPSWLFRPAEAGGCRTDDFPTGVERSGDICLAINRPQVPTIYPATAEIYFFLVRLAWPDSVGFIGFQLAGLLLSLGISALLLRLFPAAADRAAWWAWSPLLIFEGINNAHVDLLGAGLTLLAVVLLAKGKVLGSAVAFGAAVAAKLIPAIAAVGLLYRRPWRFILLSVGTFALLYLPYLLLSGPAVLGFLPGYLNEEGYDATHPSPRFALLSWALPTNWAIPIGALLLIMIALLLWRRTDPTKPWDAQALLIALALLIASPSYPWYGLLLLPFVVLGGRFEYLAVPVALTVVYFARWPDGLLSSRIALLLAALAMVTGWFWRRRSPATQAGGSSRPVPNLASSNTTR